MTTNEMVVKFLGHVSKHNWNQIPGVYRSYFTERAKLYINAEKKGNYPLILAIMAFSSPNYVPINELRDGVTVEATRYIQRLRPLTDKDHENLRSVLMSRTIGPKIRENTEKFLISYQK